MVSKPLYYTAPQPIKPPILFSPPLKPQISIFHPEDGRNTVLRNTAIETLHHTVQELIKS
jgi:hypothetical protein